MSRPHIVAVEEDPAALAQVERALGDRYARDYDVECLRSPARALRRLEEHGAAGRRVALVLAGQRLEGRPGSELLARARHIHPHAKRVLLIAWGAWGGWAVGETIFEAMSRGDLDHFVISPSAAPDERFHHEVSGFLLEWAESQRMAPHSIRVVGEAWSGRAYELRAVLGRCALPHSFWLADSPEGREILAGVGAGHELPLVLFPNGTFLADPSDADIATATGSSIEPMRSDFDLVIVGAGPAGLSAAVYAASEGVATLVVDEAGLGGQASSSSSIRNYLGFARGISGAGLARQAYEQAWLFGASFAFMQRAVRLRREPERLVVDLSVGGSVSARAVVLATGASYRRLDAPGLEALVGAGVFYGGAASEAHGMAGRDVYVLGGANSAGQAALHLARYAGRVTLVVRAPSLGAGMSSYLVHEIEATPAIRVLLGTEVAGGSGDGRLERLVLRDRAGGREETVPADALFMAIGARPHTEWLPAAIARNAQGFVLTGADAAGGAWPLDRSPLALETSMPGVLAVGDVRSGSVKRVASAVGEGSVAIQVLHELLEEEGSRGTVPRAARPPRR